MTVKMLRLPCWALAGAGRGRSRTRWLTARKMRSWTRLIELRRPWTTTGLASTWHSNGSPRFVTSGSRALTYAEIAEREQRPFLVELLTMNLAALQSAGNVLRTVTARALRDEGLTMDRIAELFGVSRQRVSALLRPTPRDEPPSSR
jgi:hypothetical protein